MDRLSKLQNLFLNKLLGVFKCPVPLMHFDLKMTLMPLRILKSKLLLYHHIITLEDRSLAKTIIDIQSRLKLFNLKDEVDPFLTRHEVLDVAAYFKVKWKKFVSKQIEEETRITLLEQAKGYKKLDSLALACEEFKLKEYFSTYNLEDARLKFRLRSNCVSPCSTMQPSDWNNIKSSHMCPHHKESPKLDLLSHWSSCPEYAKYSNNRDLSREKDLLDFYRDIIKFRMEENK